MWPGHHQRRPKLAARDVEHAAGGAVTVGTETGIVWILFRGPEHIVWWGKPGRLTYYIIESLTNFPYLYVVMS